jgi:hypothetical protein
MRQKATAWGSRSERAGIELAEGRERNLQAVEERVQQLDSY